MYGFLKKMPRVEMQVHSIHYIDLIRYFLGNPTNIKALTFNHPMFPDFKSTCSNIIMDYDAKARANITVNHNHVYGPDHQESYIKWEGSKGAIYAKMGLLLNYPDGVPDVFEYCIYKKGETPQWQKVNIKGSWFPHAFIGSMGQVMHATNGNRNALVTPISDSIHTMACVEAAYKNSAHGGTAPNQFLPK